MKYYLIIGYHLTEKNNNFPTIRISLDDKFIGEFECDNEKLSNVRTSVNYNRKTLYVGTNYEEEDDRIQNKFFLLPKVFKTFELNSCYWSNNHRLSIEIFNNNSNYTNGFMTKRSLVSFRPIYLIPESIYKSREKLSKLLKKCYTKKKIFEIGEEKENKKRWTWPGVQDQRVPEFFGGNCKINLQIKKKQNFYIITPHNLDDISLIGFPQISDVFHAWLNLYSGLNRDIKHTRVNRAEPGNVKRKDLVEIFENNKT